MSEPLDSVTVVVPTYNREAVLRRALAGYAEQSSPGAIRELVVVDDGSTDSTSSAVHEFQRDSPFPIRYIYQSNCGPAAARNRGIAEARTPVILFTDDDIIPHKDLILEHLSWHRQNPATNVAVLGYVTWDPQVGVTPFMRWYGEAGALFSYGRFQLKHELDFRFFYSCNLSLKTDFVRRFGTFDEAFTAAAYEDIELGYRLSRVGLRLLYHPQAIGYHHQRFTFSEACRKRQHTVAARRLFLQKDAGRDLVLQEKNKKRISSWLAKRMTFPLGGLLGPAKKLLDSRLPFPGIVYRGMLWYCGCVAEQDERRSAKTEAAY